MELKLNSIPQTVFDAENVENTTVKTNSGKEISRKNVIATGRLVACESVGKNLKGYNSRLNGKDVDLATLDRAHKEKKLLFCAAQANKISGKEAPANYEEVVRNSATYARDPVFLRTLAEIDREVIDPLFFSVISDAGMGLMQWQPAPLGSTTEITVRSNDVFLFEDSAWGSGRSTTKNFLYSKSVVITPKIYASNATIKWYQDIVNGDAGRYYAAIINGMYNKIYAILMQSLKAAVAGGTYVPAGLTAATYSTQNWLTITDLVAAANNLRVDDLLAIGTRSALSNLLPVDGNGGAIVGLQYGLGEAWFENGYLPKAGGVDLLPITPVIVPGTQNNELLTIDTEDNIYILGKAGRGYAPMVGVYADGSPITLTATPGGNGETAYGTADFTIDINVGAMFDIKPLFASKIGAITSVYPGN